jgi:hypothetical protein
MAGTGVYGKRLSSASRILFSFFLCIALLTALTFWFGRVSEGESKPEGILERISWAAYLAAKMLFADAEFQNVEHPVLQVARLIAPALLPLFGLLAFISSLRVRAYLWILRWWSFAVHVLGLRRFDRPLYVVIGLGRRGLERSRQILDESNERPGNSPYLVVLERDETNPYVSEIVSRRGGVVWVGDAMSDSDLRVIFYKRPQKVWIMTGDSQANLIILDTVNEYLDRPGKHRTEETPALQKIDIYAAVHRFQDRRDAASLYPLNHDTKSVWTHLFSHEDTVAAWLLKKHPVRVVNGRVPRILVIGLGELGRAVIRELMLLCHFPESRENLANLHNGRAMRDSDLSRLYLPQLVMVDSQAASYERLLEDLPFLGHPDGVITPFISSRFFGEDAINWSFRHYKEHIRRDAAFTHVFIALGSEVANISLAERIWGWERFINEADKPRHIVPVVYEDAAASWSALEGTAAENGVPEPFLLSEAYGKEAVAWEGELQKVAERIHEVYRASYNKGSPKPFDRAEEWRKMLEHDRQSNLASARYIYNRWHSHGQWHQMNQAEQNSEEECEHRRWMAFQLVANVGRFPEVGLGGGCDYKEKIVIRTAENESEEKELRKWVRVHRDMKPFDALDAKTQEKDLAVILNQRYIQKGEGPIVGTDEKPA